MKRFPLIFGIGIVAAAAGAWLYLTNGASARSTEVKTRTAKVERGEVVEVVAASGTVQPVLLVQVGTQVSGVIEKLFKDFNSPVKAGETIAQLDPRRLEAQVVQDEAALARARAEVARVKAELARAKSEERRQRMLAERKLTSDAELEAAIAAAAALAAQIEVAEAAVKQAEASLEMARVNLGYATIVSPIDGIVVSRSVDVGQTVAASLSAPTLFTIANDLTKVQIQASVPEADIGRIRAGQRATFNVDAHPERTFEGVVSQVRLASTVNQNVVTYTVLVDAQNQDGHLLPGMTANVSFEIARSPEDGLRVPSAALRLRPPEGAVEPAVAPRARLDGRAGGPASGIEAGTGPRVAARERRPGGGDDVAKVYVPGVAGRLRAVPVRRGVSDGAMTHVVPLDPAALPEGAEVVTAVIPEGDGADAPLQNPFAPPRMGGGRGGRGLR